MVNFDIAKFIDEFEKEFNETEDEKKETARILQEIENERIRGLFK